jgi:DNA-binding NarL/FixJ family response regulator
MRNFFRNYFKKTKEEKGIRIIHCDDHALFRSGVRMALKDRNNIEIIGESGNGLELLKLLETVTPDIVILNVAMPVMNGIETLPKIKEKYPDLKVIILSMHNSPEIITKMMQLGANSYLSKNTDGEAIYQAIKCVQEYNYYYSESIVKAYLGASVKFDRTGRTYSYKELKIMEFLKEKKSTREMAGELDISEFTVSAIIEKIKRTKTNSTCP